MAKITDDDILKLAELSNIEITDEQVAKFREEIQSIMEYVEQLKEVDVGSLEPTNQVTGIENAFRPDELQEYSIPAELLKNLPNREDDYIKVKRVLN